MRRKRTPINCQTCGACCVSVLGEKGFCDLEPTDVRRLPESFAPNLIVSDDKVLLQDSTGRPFHAMIKTKKVRLYVGPFAGVTITVCMALEGTVMHNVRCAIYEHRPRACRRAIKSGDKACLRLRAGFQSIAEGLR